VPGLPVVGVNNKLNFASSEKTFVSPRGSVEYIRRNMRGLGETLSASALLARLDQRGLLTYQDPHFRATNWQSLFSVSAERTTENPLYTARLGDASFQLQRYLDLKRTQLFQVRYDFNRTSLTNLLVPQLVLPRDRNVRLSTVSASYIVDTRDKPLDAHTGTYQTIDFGITPTAFGSSANFVRFLGRRSIYIPVKNMVWASRAQLGFAVPFSGSFVPTSQRFFTGGGNSLRGFPINAAGPQRLVPVCVNPADPNTCSTISVPIGGNELFIVNSELRFPLPIMNNLGGVVFYDGGNVYRHIRFSDFVNNYSNTIGFGIRYNTPVGPVRIDVGRLLEPVPGLRATQFFITIGQAF
jgi:outer membrane protein assembly factor BamA